MLYNEANCLVMMGIFNESEAAVIAVAESNVPNNLRQYMAEQVWYKLLTR
jgi:hypothetical protein